MGIVSFLTRPLRDELANLRAQIRAYGEGSIETTSAIGSELRNLSQQLDERLPELERRIEALEAGARSERQGESAER
jgi:hypothetical protein